MKKFSSFVLGLVSICTLSATPSFASAIECSINFGGSGTDVDYSALLVDVVRGTCESGRYTIEISGLGLGLRAAAGSALGISCPFSDEIAGTYGGLKVDASVFVGLDAALFVGTHGLCALGGINIMALGADLTAARIKITDSRTGRNVSAKSQSSDAVALLEENSTKQVSSGGSPSDQKNKTAASNARAI